MRHDPLESPDLFARRFRRSVRKRWQKARNRWGRFPGTLDTFLADLQVKVRLSYRELIAVHRSDPAGIPELAEFVHRLHLEDLYLALACSRGVEDAWRGFHRTFYPFLERSSHLLVRQADHVPEVLDSFYSEIYLPRTGRSVASILSSYQGRSSLRTWLRSVLFYRVTSFYETRKREPLSLGNLDREEVKVLASPGEVRDPSRPESFDLDEWANRLAGGLSERLLELSREERTLLELVHWRRETVESVGQRVGVHRATISRRLRRIHDKLFRALNGSLGADVRTALSAEEIEILFRRVASRVDLGRVLGGGDR